jgi:hypothetical protein
MTSDADDWRLLRVAPTEVEATILIARLAEAGIEAQIEGGVSAGFRAEAPGGARVLIRGRDVDRATSLLEPEEEPEPRPPAAPPTEQGPIPQRPRLTVWIFVAIILVALLVLQAVFRLLLW